MNTKTNVDFRSDGNELQVERLIQLGCNMNRRDLKEGLTPLQVRRKAIDKAQDHAVM